MGFDSSYDVHVRKGLIIDKPWISLILSGQKTWEMRSNVTSHRGWFGLIWKGMGTVYGVARLTDVGIALAPAEMIETFEYHQIPEAMIRSGEVSKWNVPWKMADVRRLPVPVRYKHKNGAVTWVEFDDGVSHAISAQLNRIFSDTPSRPVQPAESKPFSDETFPKSLGKVEITQGNIDHDHIYLRSFFDRFPHDAIGGSNKSSKAPRNILVDWGADSWIETDLDGSKKFFRARSWIASFFQANNARAGDTVSVEEMSPYRYRVRLHKRPA